MLQGRKRSEKAFHSHWGLHQGVCTSRPAPGGLHQRACRLNEDTCPTGRLKNPAFSEPNRALRDGLRRGRAPCLNSSLLTFVRHPCQKWSAGAKVQVNQQLRQRRAGPTAHIKAASSAAVHLAAARRMFGTCVKRHRAQRRAGCSPGTPTIMEVDGVEKQSD